MITVLVGPIMAMHLFTAWACNLSYDVELAASASMRAAYTHVILKGESDERFIRANPT